MVFKGRRGILTEPVVDPQIRKDIPDQEVGPAESAANEVKRRANETKTEIAEQNQMRILGIVDRAARIEVVDTAEETILRAVTTSVTLSAVLVVAGNVGQEVSWPATELLVDQVESSSQRSLFGQLVQLVSEFANTAGELLAGFGNKDHVTLHVASGFVVFTVGDLPGEVWYHQK